MGKLLSWILLFAIAYAGMRLFVVFQRKSQAAREARDERERAARQKENPARSELGERMLACAVCGVHAPASEMLSARGRFYCSPGHRDGDSG